MLCVRDMTLDFQRYDGAFVKKSPLKIISGFSVEVAAGGITAVIGSSGAGKSLLAHAVLGILPKNAVTGGVIEFKGEALTPRRLKELRGRAIALVPQSVSFLNPLIAVGRQVRRAAHLTVRDRARAARLRDEAFTRYGLGPEVKRRYPFQVSGGMARRVLTAMATVADAELIIADEPTTGLDQALIGESLGYLRRLAGAGKGVMLITHDIENALRCADRVAVFYGGRTVEVARPADFVPGGPLRHPYTRALFASLPRQGFTPLRGHQPFGDNLPAGCVFAPRCPLRSPLCDRRSPERKEINGGSVWCHHA